MVGSEELKVSRIVGENESAAEPNRCGYHQGVDSQLAVSTCCRQEVAGDPGYPHSRCHHPSESATEHVVDRLVRSRAPVELDEDGRRDAYRVVPALGAPQRSPDPLVTPKVVPGAGEGRQRLGVEDQDGQSAS
ncbi:MAG: hypothetical protein M3066_18415 [Actinomycetota bacterium]|nr:hypothetical protein [Actinomycetota bacterium]